MSGLFQKKEKLYREPVRWKKELKLAPGYLILTLWILFTLALLGWVLMASFSTTKEIFSNKLLESGFHGSIPMSPLFSLTPCFMRRYPVPC